MPPGAQAADASWAGLQHHVLNKLEENANATKDVQDEVRDLTNRFTSLDGKVDKQGDDIKQLLTLVRDGNGRSPLLVRQELLEQRVIQLEKEKDGRDADSKTKANGNRSASLSLVAAILLFVVNALWGVWKDTQRDLQAQKDRSAIIEQLHQDKKP